MTVAPLPIDPLLPEIVAAARDPGLFVLHAPTGAGKTTRVPRALHLAGLSEGGTIWMLEPRRIAARAAARRMADELGEKVGETVGYHVRFDRVAGPKTKILVVTEGILLRQLQRDPFLTGISAVLFDEFHERGLDADLALALVRQVREAREELVVGVMSATLDGDRVAQWLGGAKVLRSQGRAFPVELRYLPFPDQRPLEDQVVDAVKRLAEEDGGDLLAFLPGTAEIFRCAGGLSEWAERTGRIVLPLYGDLGPEDQDKVLRKANRQKVVLATNVAETSLTIDGVTAVIDGGLVRVQRVDPDSGLNRLSLEANSRASADQRAGRAGRTQPGRCLRLWTERSHPERPAQTEPEVRRVDLSGPILELIAWGERDPLAFPWFEAPDARAVGGSLELLGDLGFVKGGILTDLGRDAVSLPVHPRVARLVLHAARFPSEASLAAAWLSDRDPLPRGQEADHDSDSDLCDRLDLLLQAADCRDNRVRGVMQVAERLEKDAFGKAHPRPRFIGPEAREALGRAVLAGWPDRVAARREPGSPRGRLVGGRGVTLDRRSALRTAALFVALDLDDAARGPGAEALVRVASEVEPGWLSVTEQLVVKFDPEKERAQAWIERRYRDLPLSQRLAERPDPALLEAAMIETVGKDLRKALPDEPELGWLLQRLRFVGRVSDEPGPFEDVDAFVRGLLPEVVRGRRTLTEIRRAPWHALALQALSFRERQVLDRLAPQNVEVPSGSHVRIDYPDEGPPVLAVRIQEIYGWEDGPRVADGRIGVLLHLLTPNHLPAQITDDLAGFWDRTYAEVRKEMRVRYPRHAWPEDPREGIAERRPKRRG